LAVALVVMLSVPNGAAGQATEDSVAAARQLYANAAYDEALGMLDRLERTGAAADRDVPLTRALCLMGLNREDEARGAMTTLVDLDPRFELDPADASPRVRELLRSVRAERLPAVVRTRYAASKAAFDAKDFNAAAARFGDLMDLMKDPVIQRDATLADLRTLAQGFADLSKQLSTAGAAPEPSTPSPPDTAAASESTPETSTPPGNQAAAQPVATPPSRSATTANAAGAPTSGDAVVKPVPVTQRAPEWPPQLGRVRGEALLASVLVVIDETGGVTSARTHASVNPVYDSLLVDAARRWKYKPATKGGVPVPYTLLVTVSVR
jgi:TonB family protein